MEEELQNTQKEEPKRTNFFSWETLFSEMSQKANSYQDKKRVGEDLRYQEMLQIGKFLVSEEVNGPGRRFVIWFQGCPLRCKGCFNLEFWDEEEGESMTPQELIGYIQQANGIEGVTFTGGEPLIQAEQLIPLAQMIKTKNLSIVCYTGYTLKEILDNKLPYAKELLKYIDILIDGRYNEKEKASLLWRGSRNQKVYFLTERYKHLKSLVSKEESKIEIKVGRDNFIMTGIFDLEIWQKLYNKLTKIIL